MAALALHLVHLLTHPSVAQCQVSRGQGSPSRGPCTPLACQVHSSFKCCWALTNVRLNLVATLQLPKIPHADSHALVSFGWSEAIDWIILSGKASAYRSRAGLHACSSG